MAGAVDAVRLAEIEALATVYPAVYRRGANCEDTLALCAAVRAERAEVARLRREAEAAGAEAAELRRELDHLVDSCEVGKTMAAVRQARGVLTASPSRAATIAKARRAVCEAAQKARGVHGLPSYVVEALHALAEAEREAVRP